MSAPSRLAVLFAGLLLVSSACAGRAPAAAGPAGQVSPIGAGGGDAAGQRPAPASPTPRQGPLARPLAAAQPCDGAAVLCVAIGGAGGGTAAAPYGRVQDAVDAAGPGTVVQVAQGEFAENVAMGAGVALRGGFSDDFASRPAAAVTTIVGQGAGPTVLIDFVDDVEVEGFSLTGGTGLCFGTACDGGGIAAAGNGLLIASNRLFDNTLSPETDSNGGGLSVAGQAEVVANVIEGNRGGNGAGLIGGGELRIVGNVIRGNVSAGDHGGGAFLTGQLTLEDNLFEGNRVGEALGYGWGGGVIIATEGTTFTARGNVYRGNHAPSSGAGSFIDDGADGSMTNELIVGNDCLQSEPGGAVYIDALDASGDTGSVVEIVNTTIAANRCGLGIDVENVASVATVRNSIIVDNLGPAVATVGGASAAATYTLADEALAGSGNLTGDPAFAGGGDYHLRSAGGRFDPGSGTFVIDADTSPGVDAGDPADPFGVETAPNGGRVNLGAYGGTSEASRSPGGSPGGAVSVHAGAGRVQTAVAASTSSFPAAGSAAAAVLARENDFADALSGAALAVAVGGPLLLSHTDTLTPDTAAELQRLLPAGAPVHLLGGTAALGDAVATAVNDLGFSPQRHAGETRFETATAIADAVAAARTVDTVFLAAGGTFPDALVAGADAQVVGGVLLLTSGSAPHPATQAWLAARPQAPQIAVGAAAISAHPAAEPVGGEDPYATAAQLAARLFASPAAVGVASGVVFPDALAGGAHIGRLDGPLLLSQPDSLPAPTREWLQSTPSVQVAHVYGGDAAIAPSVRAELASLLAG